MRGKEYMTATPAEFVDFGNDRARFNVPLRRVKKRRNLIIPMSRLAQEIVDEALKLKDGKQPFVFPGKFDGKALDAKSQGKAVRGYTDKKGKVVRQGVWQFLGMKPWTPHDLRRTCATLAGELGFSKAQIALCLDHRIEHGDDAAPTVTDVYELSERVKEKKQVLDAVAAELGRIIGPRSAAEQPAEKLKEVG